MKRSTNILVGIAAAIITFGVLTLSFGARHTHWRGGFHDRHYGYHDGDSCRWEQRQEQKQEQ